MITSVYVGTLVAYTLGTLNHLTKYIDIIVKILLIRGRFAHMGIYSGYDRLGNYLTSDTEFNFESISRDISGSYLWGIGRLLKYFRHKFNATTFYTSLSFRMEVYASIKLILKRFDLVHIFNLEDQLGFLPQIRKVFFPTTKIIATAHQPASWYKLNNIKPDWLNNLDGLIVLDRSSYEFFKNYIGEHKIYIVPHGIDIFFFKPAFQKISQKRCISVGKWLRDFDLLEQVIQILLERNADIQFDLVVNLNGKDVLTTVFRKLAKHKNLHFHSNISDTELLALYQQADVLVLPLIDSTANNALLEAMATGLPVITTPSAGIYDYVDIQNTIIHTPNDPEGFSNNILNLLNQKNILERMGEFSRKKAITFNWEIIKEKTYVIYHKVITDQPTL